MVVSDIEVKMLRLRLFFLLIITLCLLFVPAGSIFGQNSSVQNLVQSYKEQNPHKLKPPSQQPMPQPKQSVAHANQPSGISAQDVPHVASAMPPNGSMAPQRTIQLPLGGDPKDPLNIYFDPEWEHRPNRPPLPFDEPINDSRLNDVFFADKDCGWAVGDRGVIWHTSDGGVTWTLQKTPIRCSLRSVYFVNRTIGLAVGGYLFPFTGQGRGVVLTTSDGGNTWSLLPTDRLPFLHRVKMFDPMKGILAGESSERFPTGLFATVDGGRNWQPAAGTKSDGWISVDFLDEKNGIGIGPQGTLRATHADKIVQSPSVGALSFSQVKLVGGAAPPGTINGWLVGDGGLVMYTQDAGFRWGVAGGAVSDKVSALVDLKTVEYHDKNVWVAGSPGTMIYASADQGKTWKNAPTGSTAPISRLFFIDGKHGWAVGELGTILSTVDGGAKWTVQRAGAKRLAMLGFFAKAEEIPLEAYIQVCANQGYLGGATLLFRDKDRRRERIESPWTNRVHEALLRTGANGVWELGPFTLEHEELSSSFEKLVEQIQKEGDGKGLERLRERLVLSLRQWMPDVVLMPSLGESKDPVRKLALQEIVAAIDMASDPKAFPFHITELGLQPWKVKKIHLVLEKGVLGDVNLTTTEPMVRLGQPIDELAYTSYGIIDTQWKDKPAIIGFSTWRDEAPPNGSRDFFAGLDVPFGEARRPFLGSYADRWEEIRDRIRHRRNALGILRHMSQVAKANGRSKSDVRLASNAAELTRKIDQDTAVQILLDMGRQYHHVGDSDSAWEAFDLMVKQYPGHPLTRHAFAWLLRYYAAEENLWRHQYTNVWSQELVSPGALRQGTGWAVDRQRIETGLDRAIALGRYLEQNFPDLAEDAELRFAWASALRRRGWGVDAAKYYRTRSASSYDDVWSMRARAEHWLSITDKSELPPEKLESPLPALQCSYTPQKPLLDGRFDNEFDQGTWFASKLYTLTPDKPRARLKELLLDRVETPGMKREERARTASKVFGTQVMFMYDKEYLYVGLRCKRVAGFSYPPIAEKPRVRDAVIDDQDRVEILLDIDRDYGVFHALTIDSRGWVVDACWDDAKWNPEWFVARHEDKDYWYIEAAIPLAALAPQPPLPQTVWAVALRRIVPGFGIECWNAENAVELSEGFGFLVFE